MGIAHGGVWGCGLWGRGQWAKLTIKRVWAWPMVGVAQGGVAMKGARLAGGVAHIGAVTVSPWGRLGAGGEAPLGYSCRLGGGSWGVSGSLSDSSSSSVMWEAEGLGGAGAPGGHDLGAQAAPPHRDPTCPCWLLGTLLPLPPSLPMPSAGHSHPDRLLGRQRTKSSTLP